MHRWLRHPTRVRAWARLWAPLALAPITVLGALGCEVSVFGSEPVQVFGGVGPTRGGEAGACGEPEETRRVRARLEDGEPPTGEASPCAYHCVFEDGALTEASRQSCPLASVDTDGTVHLDMTRADGVFARLEVCAQTVVQLGDSIGARADGSDDPSTSHDASVLVHRGELDLLPAHEGGLSASHVNHYLSEEARADEACTLRTLTITDALVYLVEIERGLCGTSMLRIDPPTDSQGSPDSLWHLTLGRSLDGSVTGAPPPRLDLCFL